MWGRKGLEKLKTATIEKVAPKVDKQSMLDQLESSWRVRLKGDFDIEDELIKARNRIDSSGSFKLAFDKVGVTDEDIRKILTNIKENKPKPFIREEPKIGRNEPCPCGSGKKYKKCCLYKEVKEQTKRPAFFGE